MCLQKLLNTWYLEIKNSVSCVLIGSRSSLITKWDVHVFISSTNNDTKKHLSDPPAGHQPPSGWNWICSTSRVPCPVGAWAGAAVGSGWKHREGCRLREQRLWRSSALTPAARGLGTHSRQSRLWLCPLSCDTPFLKWLSGLYPIYCTSVLTEKWCQCTQTGLSFADTKGRSLLQHHTYQARTGAQGSSLVLGRSSLDRAVAPLGFSTLTVLHRSSLIVLLWLQCRKIARDFGWESGGGLCSDLYSKKSSLNFHKNLKVAELQNNALIQVFVWFFCKAASVHLPQEQQDSPTDNSSRSCPCSWWELELNNF